MSDVEFFDKMVTDNGLPRSYKCVYCRGSKMLCGKDRCPLMVKFYSQSKTARIIEDRSTEETAGLYDRIGILMENTGKSRTIQLVTTLRQDALKGLISKESPVGKAVMGRRVGDRAEVDMGNGRSYTVRILSIEKGEDDGSIPIGSF